MLDTMEGRNGLRNHTLLQRIVLYIVFYATTLRLNPVPLRLYIFHHVERPLFPHHRAS
jgi:hypothetical protein